MTRSLADLLPFPAAVELIQTIDRTRGREVAAALVGFLVWSDVRECEFVAGGKLDSTLRVPATTTRPKEGTASGSQTKAMQLSF